MSRNKGQVSLIDVLMLSVIVSFVLIAGNYYTSRQEILAQEVREESLYSQAMLISGLEYRFDLGNSYKNVSTAEYIAIHLCNYYNFGINEPSRETLRVKLTSMFDQIIKTDYNYIFFARISPYDIPNVTAYNNQKTVCGKYVPVVSAKSTFICPQSKAAVQIEYFMGIWPKWKQYPPTC